MAAKPAPLYDLLRNLSTDMHQASSRGCQTCRDMTEKLGWSFGCYELQERLRKSRVESTKVDKTGPTIKRVEAK